MWLAIGVLVLLTSSITDAYGVKGGSRIIQQASGLQGIGALAGKGGGLGKLHHSALVQDPVIASLGPSSAQFSLSDAQIPSFGQRRLYRVGQSQVPYGLLGSDYYSYPANLPRRVLRRKTVASSNLSGLRGIADPSLSQFQIGDAQIKTPAFGSRRNLYRVGASSVPYGLMGLDYYSYPKQLFGSGGYGLSQAKILSGGSAFTAGDSQLRGGLDSIAQERVIVDPSSGILQTTQQQVIPEQVSVLDDALGAGFGQRKFTTISTAPGFGQRQIARPGGLRGGQIILRGTPGLGVRRVRTQPVAQAPISQLVVDGTSGLGAPIGGFGQRQAPVIVSQPAYQAPVIVSQPAYQAPVIVSQPAIQAPVGVRRRVVRPGDAFLSQVARPRLAQRRVVARPVSQERVAIVPSGPAFGAGNVQFSLGDNQLVGGPIFSSRPSVAISQPQVLSQIRDDANILASGLFGQRRIPQMYYVDGGHRFPGIDIIGGSRIGDPRLNYARLPISTGRFANLGRRVVAVTKSSPSKIGGSSLGGLLGVGQTSPSKVVTQEEVIGPAGDTQAVITTVTKSGPSKIGGPAFGGLAGIGQAAPIVTQEEVVGPAGDTQAVITTVTKSGPSKIGGPVIGGLGGIGGLGQTAPIVTQEEVVGPAGDTQAVITTVTKSGPSKIGGPVIGGLGGIGGLGQTAPIVTQEEVVGPAGDTQAVITTVTKSGSSKIGGPVIGGLGGIGGLGQTAPIVTQEEVVGPAGDTQAVITTVTKSGPSKIGGPVIGGLGGIGGFGQTAPIVTQEEVLGPAGDTQAVITTVTKSGPSKIGGPVVGGLSGIAGLGQAPATITQEEVIGPAGDSQLVTTVTKTGPSKIGGPAIGGLSGIAGLGQSTKTVTQEEVIGPAGDSQLVTTVTKTSPSKIGGPAFGGFPGAGQSSPSIVTQEQVIGPAGDLQTVTTVSKAVADPVVQQEFIDPVSAAVNDISQSSISGDGFGSFSPFGQSSLLDPIGSGQATIDDVIAQSPFTSDVAQVKETTITEPGGVQFTPVGPVAVGGKVTKVTQVSQPISQQPISQHSISGSDFGLGDYLPRVSFMSQYPYDVPGRSLLRSVLTRPIVQEQQPIEQFLV